MQLSDIDDLPFHQTPTPFNILATSDVHFNDGYYFSTYAEDWYLAVGLRLHPNNNVMDGFVSLARHGEQRSCRFSRALRPQYSDLTVGPLSIRFPTPMQSARVSLTDSPIGLSFDLEFKSIAIPFLETPYRHWRYGRLINDIVRYTQMCRTHGSIVWDGNTVPVEAWHAMRDHSWGIRASMGPRTPSHGVPGEADETDARRFRIWVPFEVEGHSGFFHTHEAEDGSTLDFEGALDFDDGRRVKLVGVEHALEYSPGTKNVIGGRFNLRDEAGAVHEYTFRSAGTSADVQGSGYLGGWKDGERPGTYRGMGPIVEFDRYPSEKHLIATGPPHVPVSKRFGQTEFPSFLTGPLGARGMAHFEHHVFGAYQPYGFTAAERRS